MSEVPPGDFQRWRDELQRCHLLSLQMIAPLPPLRVVQTRDAKYYAERGRVLRLVGPERGVAFLRDEALDALAGRPPLGPAARWYSLHVLEFGYPRDGGEFTVSPVLALMNAGLRSLEAEGIADEVAQQGRETRAAAAARCRYDSAECGGACRL